jgi:hypothetical protein
MNRQLLVQPYTLLPITSRISPLLLNGRTRTTTLMLPPAVAILKETPGCLWDETEPFWGWGISQISQSEALEIHGKRIGDVSSRVKEREKAA